MSSRGVIVAALAFVTLLAVTPTAAADQHRRPEPEPEPTRLWRLYPLDPEEGRSSREVGPEASPSPVPPVESEVSVPFPRTVGEIPGAVRRDGPSGWTTLAVLGAASMAVMAWSVRRGRERGAAGAPPDGTPDVASTPVDRPIRGAIDTPPPREQELVRLHLRSGRVVQGRLRQSLSVESPVILVDVVSASDPEGRRVRPRPTDAFILATEVENIETINGEGKLETVPKGEV